ncbi:hypothetical protein HF1_10110 [Mycoplasma haemofelis str. Langford 1]|uniref:Uncharacterized protein n=2 Tax=Mycoplasma haemofelis TaxID=29501 RepID=F6FJJ3_MYCHI|nr:hypothetical protein [Mycoplasma haemofelis]AEG73348.1 hypothetical protein MHF_1100 [Mycoplasma haemofelis Ohio2]CBY93019.1 hypothetical protein HF1_10110 [Mycoplasma haemofelis str. Langford 1]
MSLSKVGLGFAGLAGVSGAGYLGLRNLSSESKESFKTKYALAVKDFLSDDTILGKKLTSLSASGASTPKHKDLVSAQEHKKANRENEAKTALKRGCSDIHDKPVDSDFFEDFKNYCSFNNGDKLEQGKTVVSANGDFTSKWTSFNGKSSDELQKGFKTINKPTDGASNTTWQATMLAECKKLSLEIFEGTISNFVEFCSKQA